MDEASNGIPAAVQALIGVAQHAEESSFPIEMAYVYNTCAAVQNGNPLYWDEAVAREITHGWITPPTMMSVWFRPHYWVPGASGELLSRRRLVQYVNLGVYELLPPRKPTQLRRAYEDGQLHLVTSMRLRSDFGSYVRRGDDYAARLVQSMDGRQIDVLFAYLEGQNLGGMVDVRAGRQFEMSGLDFFAFDGGWVRAEQYQEQP